MSTKKILCLHGFVQNGPLFARKSSGVRKALKKLGYETIFLTAPVKLELADLPFDVDSLGGSKDSSESMRSWWPNNVSSPEFYKLDYAFEAVKESIVSDGPYDGVLGFSQGAGLAGILCQMMHDLHESQPPLKFGIFYSGFRAAPEQHQHFYKTPISVPSIHIMGSLDTVVSEERTMALFNACSEETRTMVVHPGGHFVPNGKDMVTKVTAWLSNVDGSAQETTNDAVANGTNGTNGNGNANGTAVESWDEFDKIGAA